MKRLLLGCLLCSVILLSGCSQKLGDFTVLSTKENGIVAHFMQSVLDLRGANRLPDAFKTMLMCIRLHPLDFYYYKPFVYFLTPLTIINCYRGIKAWRTAARFHVGA